MVLTSIEITLLAALVSQAVVVGVSYGKLSQRTDFLHKALYDDDHRSKIDMMGVDLKEDIAALAQQQALTNQTLDNGIVAEVAKLSTTCHNLELKMAGCPVRRSDRENCQPPG